ncbi:ImmA/IrrE family metallo-endopeptidase [Ferrovibrio xuzhouensis]|uniref:ImmA/IrrE family metallo-endopeptidase n=1 Tax=Ferrovibrio xuzhouensis TaxID=1576914 RepID=A0ABV7VA69_9PROT
MRHGFKAKAERLSAAAREELSLGPLEPLDPWAYADSKGVIVLEFDALDLGAQHKTHLTQVDGDSWSGLTIQQDGFTAILINPSHAKTRQRSTLTHELAHLLLLHVPARVEVSSTGVLLLSDYSEEQESEADWLAAALLLPREGLLRRRNRGEASIEIANYYGVSEKLCTWRIRMTGIDVQLRRSRR